MLQVRSYTPGEGAYLLERPRPPVIAVSSWWLCVLHALPRDPWWSTGVSVLLAAAPMPDVGFVGFGLDHLIHLSAR